MFFVSDILPDVKRVLGACDDATAYRRINYAVEILSTEAIWDSLRGYMDVCVGCNGCVTLPRQVGTVLAVNVCGRPTQGHDFWFNFHLNGPGESRDVAWHWFEELPTPVFRSMHTGGSRLRVRIERPSDEGRSFRVYGYGVSGDWIRSLENGVFVDGFLVPLTYRDPSVNPVAPLISRIERIDMDASDGMRKLYAISADGTSEVRVGNYYPEETFPQYRQIQVTPGCSSVRVAFKKAVSDVSAPSDIIPLHSKYALVLMVMSLRKLDEDRIDEADAYQRKAVSLLMKKQESVEVPSGPTIQVADQNLIADRSDRLE